MRKWTYYFIGFAVVVVAVIGLYYRQTYTDFTSDEDHRLELSVFAWLDEINDEHMDYLRKLLPESPYILKVEGTGVTVHQFDQNLQKVIVREVYAGDGLEDGDEIFVFHGMDSYILSQKEANLSFANWFKEGKDYLLFIYSEFSSVAQEIDPVYALETFIIQPSFVYDVGEQVIIPVTIDDRRIPYSEVKDNDFFAGDEASMQSWLELNKYMTSLYP